VGKVTRWRTKAAISLKRVKIDEKLLWRAYRKSPTLFHNATIPTPYGLPFPKIVGSQVLNPNPKLQSLLSQERVKLRTSNSAAWQVHSQGTSEQKGAWAYPGTAQFFWVPPFISGMSKATNFKFCMHVHRIDCSGVTTDPADPAMREGGGARPYGGPKLYGIIFFTENLTQQFSCVRALPW